MKVQLRGISNRLIKHFAAALNQLNQHVQQWVNGLEPVPFNEAQPQTHNLFVSALLSDIKTSDRSAEAELGSQTIPELNQRIIATVQAGVIVLDRNLCYRTWNRFMENLSGCPAEQVLGKYCLDIFPVLSDNGGYALLERALAGETLSIPEELFQLPESGKSCWISTQLLPLHNQQGTITGVLGIVQDITEIKESNTRLQESEAQQRALINALPDLIMRLTGEGVYLDFLAAKNFQVIGGKVLIGTRVEDSLPPDLAQKRLEAIQVALQTGELQIYEQEIWINDALRTEECRVLAYGSNEVLIIGRDITDRKQAEGSLRKSEERWHLAIEGSNDGIWDHNLITNEHFLSPRCLEVLGYDYIEIDSFQKWFELIHPEDQPTLRETFQSYLEGRMPIYAIEYRMRCKNGKYKWLLARGKAFWDETGTPLRATGSITDITIRKLAETTLQEVNEELERRVQERTQELARSERDLHTIFNTVYDAILIHDLDGTILDANDRAFELYGATREQLLGATLSDLSAPDAPLDRLPDILQQIQTGEPIQLEWRERRFNDHAIFDAEISLRQVTLGNRSVFIAAVRDISERKRIEDERQQAEKALQASEARLAEKNTILQSVIESTPDVVFVKDQEGRIVIANSSFVSFFGQPLAALVGKDDAELWPPAMARQLRELDLKIMATGVAQTLEESVPHPDGMRTYLTTKSPWYNTQGQVIGTIGISRDISDRKQAEIALCESQRFLQTVIDTFPLVVFWKDRHSVYLGCNQASVMAAGLGSPAEIVGKTDYDLPWGKTEGDAYRADDREVIHSGIAKLGIIETQVRADGSKIWIETNKLPLYNLSGEIIGVLGTYQDITSRKQAEEALRDSEERLRLALTATNQGLYDLNLQTGEAIVSPEYATMLGFEPSTFQETNAQWIKRLHPDDQKRVAATYRAYLAQGLPSYKVEFRQRTKDGQWKWILSLGKIVAWDDAGQPLRMLGTHTDIDERKRAEQALQESEERFRQLAENVGQIFWLTDLESKLLYVNPAFEQIWGQRPHDLLDFTRSLLDTIHPDDRPWVKHRMTQKLQGSYDIEYRIVRSDGEVRWIRDRAFLIRNKAGEVYRIGGIAEDITDRKRLEQELRQINAELERRVEERTTDLKQAMEAAEAANRAKSTFLANMSHELRTPLNAILGFAQLMGRDQNLEAEKRQQLGIINHSGEHLLHLINDILEMSKIEAGRTSFIPTCFDLYTLLNILKEMFDLRVREKGLQLIVDRALTVPQYIETDENKLRQVLINLISNAIKFTIAGRIVLRITARTKEVENQNYKSIERYDNEPPNSRKPLSSQPSILLSFEVEDTGIGIALDELESLFEPFIQSGRRQLSQEGTGLGLAISRQFVQLMGGELTVDSQLEAGSSFKFSIPARLAKPCATLAASSSRSIIRLAPNQSYRILVVEDNDTNRQLLVQLLQSIGFIVQAASNGQEAIALWESWKPQLIWMDIRMPILDGYESTQQIRNRELQAAALAPTSKPAPAIIIALTANVFEEDRARALDIGCNDFVRKPFREAELLQKMATYLGVQYLYADDDQRAIEPPDPLSSSDAIAALQSLPDAWLTQLHQATLQLDSTQIAALVEEISPKQPLLASLLMQKLNNFDLQQILNLIEQARQTEL